MRVLTIKGLEKQFTIHHLNHSFTAISELNLHVNEGGFLGIVGKSGSGKSTILKSIYRTYDPQQGEIIFHSKAFGEIDLLKASHRQILHLRKYEIGYVSQFLNVMPRTTALQLVMQSLLEIDVPKEQAEVEAKAALTHFDLDEKLWNSYPNNFSGGEKLRLNIACAVVKKPRLLLLDEPTASLDNQSKQKVRESIEKLKLQGTTLIGIFHDLEFMDGLCDDVLEMNNRNEKDVLV